MKSPISKVNRGFALISSTAAVLLSMAVAPGAEEAHVSTVAQSVLDDCDRLAGSPNDNQRNGAFSPVAVGEIDLQAVDSCRIAFNATGNPRFAYQLGRALNQAQEIDEAMTAYQAAVDADYPAAKVNFGMLMGRLGDAEAEFQMYSQAAESGNVLASYNLGVAYRDGLGTAPDAEKALHWFQKAAAAGDDTAAFNIAVIYDEGTLVPADDQTAIAWYDLAAARGNVDAMVNLGIMLETGEGIEPDVQQAAELYAKAAENGDLFGATRLMELQQAGVLAPPSAVAALDEGMRTLVLKDGDIERPASLAREI
ncbi:TPR repeat protein [Pseudorhizobium tarimense]|uniref:TPR repeat protein n=1 Tax=Pseudorhizobium tarimense TaxID=1079109 RepID=A0ABV2H9V9_9HYPH|nr:tetratricopeptide repeat protein [Pseudorhizobium tarimense]MCJ8520452.1 sel1 repeat family protein [Pseudorhizobium tarimense]